MIRPLYIYLLLLIIMVSSCRKDSFTIGADAEIELSADSLHFDTLFTTTGSVTQAFKLFNRNNSKLRIGTISLGGQHSYFRFNADGFEGPDVKDIEIAANDSIYIFVTVKINPDESNLPFIAQDSISIQFNGVKKVVQLDAWGQNAHFLRATVITANTTWTNEKPYVILGGLQVAQNVVLTIEKGTKIFLHGDAPLIIDGSLKVNGEKTESMEVVFAGDRLDDPYKNYPGAWPGIYFREKSKDNTLTHVLLKNAYQGIVVEKQSVNSNPKLTLDRCIIDNCYDAGITGSQTSIEAVNCLISNCGKNIQLLNGGTYSFTNCTVAAFSNPLIAHKQPVMTITNFVRQGGILEVSDLKTNIRNCIFWGDNGIVADEVVVLKEESDGVFEVDFKNTLWKVATPPEAITSSGMVNTDPLFVNIDTRNNVYNFRIDKNSHAVDAGIFTGITADLDDNSRSLTFPDAGAYETTF